MDFRYEREVLLRGIQNFGSLSRGFSVGDSAMLGTGDADRYSVFLVVFHGSSSLQVELCVAAAGFLLNAMLPSGVNPSCSMV